MCKLTKILWPKGTRGEGGWVRRSIYASRVEYRGLGNVWLWWQYKSILISWLVTWSSDYSGPTTDKWSLRDLESIWHGELWLKYTCSLINPRRASRRACAARVTVVVVCVCLSVTQHLTSRAMNHSTRYSALGIGRKVHRIFSETTAFESYGVKTKWASQCVFIGLAYLSTRCTCSAYLGGTRGCNAGRVPTLACYLVV